jgi:hypothetical protein
MLYSTIKSTLYEVVSLLDQLDEEEYQQPCPALSDGTIGQHTRHIIEMFQCLMNNYHDAEVNYDLRKRNKRIESEADYAIACIKEIILSMEKENKPFMLIQNIAGSEVVIESSYHRELLYNLEHCIHHQALIKVAVLGNNKVLLHENFGVAPSTIQYKKSCVQ